jgi:tRNA G18 (ribose-2'-O)-methylase SpoU
LFTLPFAWGEMESFLRGTERRVYLADLEGACLRSMDVKTPLALILSNEGRGVSPDVEGQKILIPMQGDVESLNVAAAGAILLHAMRHP